MNETNQNCHLNNETNSAQLAGDPFQGNFRYYSGIDWLSLLFHLLDNIIWILLAAILGALIAGFYAMVVETPIYQTTSKIYIAGSETTISLSDIQLGASLAKDYQEVFKIWHVHEMVDERLGLDYSYSALAGKVSVSNPDGSHLLYISVRSSDPQEAKLLADTYAEVVQEFIAEKMELRKPQLLQVAELPTRPVSPNVKATVLKGFLFGAVLAGAAFIVQYLLDDRIRTGEDIEKATGLVTLGILMKQDSKSKVQDETENPASPDTAEIRKNLSLDYAGNESINTICSGIVFSGKNLKRIAVTSYEPNNGKTFIAMRIAHSMAKRGKKVLLIDADFRKSVMITHYRISNIKMGLAHYLSGQCSQEKIIYKTNLTNLYMIPIGEIVKNPLPLLTSGDFEKLMNDLINTFDLIIVDTPPVGAVIDAAEIAKCCDGSLLVLEYNRESTSDLRYMQRMMEQTKTPVIGCIINNVVLKKLHQSRYYYYQYRENYGNYGEEHISESHHSKTHSRDKGE